MKWPWRNCSDFEAQDNARRISLLEEIRDEIVVTNQKLNQIIQLLLATPTKLEVKLGAAEKRQGSN